MADVSRSREPRVVIIGAGVSGITMGIKLQNAGLTNFRILDAESAFGGTWRINTYPGAAVDIHSLVYQFGFKNHHWRRTHAVQSDLLAYIEEVVAEAGLQPHFTFDCRVLEARWDEDGHHYVVTTASGETIIADVLVSSVGQYSNPQLPDWPGLDSFEGDVFHTTNWDHSVDLAGRNVAVVGVGSSSAQIVPAIAPTVGELTVFMREPGWVLPKGERDFTTEEYAKLSRAWYRRWARYKVLVKKEWLNLSKKPNYVDGSKRNREEEAFARAYIDRTFADRPDLRTAFTPSYPIEGKRIVLSDDFYPAFLRENVRLVPRAVASAGPAGLVDSAGNEYPFDLIVTATGFTCATFLATFDVYGRGGRRLQDVWADGAFAYMGMTVPGFPNFYMQFGPNTNGAGAVSLFWKAEQQANWVVRDIKRMMRTGMTAIDTKESSTQRYNDWLQKRLERTVWAKSNNYFRDSSGRVVTQFYGSITTQYWLLRLGRPLGTYGVRRSDRSTHAVSARP